MNASSIPDSCIQISVKPVDVEGTCVGGEHENGWVDDVFSCALDDWVFGAGVVSCELDLAWVEAGGTHISIIKICEYIIKS